MGRRKPVRDEDSRDGYPPPPAVVKLEQRFSTTNHSSGVMGEEFVQADQATSTS